MFTKEIDQLFQSIIHERPWLKEFLNDKPILEYLRPALTWKQNKDIFPYTNVLSNIICSHIERLYGQGYARQASKQLITSWVIETGAHLHIPRRYDRIAAIQGPQINSLLFQGQVLWVLANKAFGSQVSISLNSGRVPLDNTNSGALLDLPGLKSPMRLASKENHPDSPQSLIPARTKEEIEGQIALLNMYKKQKILPSDQYILGKKILDNFVLVQTSFSDQVATSHALMLNSLLPIKQLTLDSELIGRDFAIALLKDPTSLTYTIFNDKYKRAKFLEYLGNIRTGWKENESPFFNVNQRSNGFRLTDYTGELIPALILKGLENKTLWLTGVMKFFILMVEGGILPVGGWTQTGYCTQIKVQSEKLLHEFGYEDRSQALRYMPTYIASASPCWGIDIANGDFQLLDAITTILNPSSIDLSNITQLTTSQTFLIAAPTLYQFLFGKPPPVNYSDLKNTLDFAIMRK